MGLLDGTTQQAYYNGDDFGGYQFTSLEDIINQFLVAYVGEEKIISKASRTDVAFHAQRAMQELSFDTFKSIKSQEIVLPPSNTMILPHDYVNYTRVMWSDSAGIKHPLYPTRDTQNPFKIKQLDSGVYDFSADTVQAIINNSDFSSDLDPNNDWNNSNVASNPTIEDISSGTESLKITHGSKSLGSPSGQIVSSRAYAVWQPIDVSGIDVLTISASGISAQASAGVKDAGVLRFGVVSSMETPGGLAWDPVNKTNPNSPIFYGQAPAELDPTSRNHLTNIFDLQTTGGDASYIEFDDGLGTASTKTLEDINVSNYSGNVYLVITSYIPNYTTLWAAGNESSNIIDDINVLYDGFLSDLQSGGESTTWSNYKSGAPSENQSSYDDDYYVNALGQRYGLNPQHAQVNGSYYIDNLRGLINFSSNISGKTVILDYISDSLGTDGEMQVHKFAEEAMYKWIMYAILSTRANTPEHIVRRYKKEKFAATRQAKLRLSNIKLEELTQTLRGKSKHIKH